VSYTQGCSDGIVEGGDCSKFSECKFTFLYATTKCQSKEELCVHLAVGNNAENLASVVFSVFSLNICCLTCSSAV